MAPTPLTTVGDKEGAKEPVVVALAQPQPVAEEVTLKPNLPVDPAEEDLAQDETADANSNHVIFIALVPLMVSRFRTLCLSQEKKLMSRLPEQEIKCKTIKENYRTTTMPI